jgi:hypothetical protein
MSPLVMVFDFGYGGKRYLYDLAVLTLHLHARRGQGLSGFHAPNDASDALAIERDDLDIVFAVERPERRECFCHFHRCLLSFPSS